LLSGLFSGLAFLLAWVLALIWDQPFAPLLVVLAVLQALGVYGIQRVLC